MTTTAGYMHEPVSVMPAEGWRAVYLTGDTHFTVPLVGWVICRVTDDDDGWTELHGYVLSDGHVECAEESRNHVDYVPPGAPDPVDPKREWSGEGVGDG